LLSRPPNRKPRDDVSITDRAPILRAAAGEAGTGRSGGTGRPRAAVAPG
jgi:hypothetical protein